MAPSGPAERFPDRSQVANAADCEQALHELAARMGGKDAAARTKGFDRTLSCTITDLHVSYAGRLHDGLLDDIAVTDKPNAAQVRLELTGDDLVAVVAGQLNFGSAWAAGRIKVHAGIRDMLKLRSVF